MASPFTPPTIPGAQGYPLGLTGASSATRYVGATASGAPASGTFAVGDFVIDQSGSLYVCTVAGSPGTWTEVGGASATGADGWVDDTAATWTRTAATTFTVTGDRTAVFSNGTRLKLTQTTAKYFVVVDSSHAAGTTTVTVSGGTDYTLAAAAITDNYYSYAANPQGYPGYFSYTPAWTSAGTQPALGNGTIAGRFAVVGSMVQVQIELVAGGSTTYGTGTYAFSLPIATTLSFVSDVLATARAFDNSGSATYIGLPVLGSTTTLSVYTLAAPGALWTNLAPMTWAASDRAKLFAAYEMA